MTLWWSRGNVGTGPFGRVRESLPLPSERGSGRGVRESAVLQDPVPAPYLGLTAAWLCSSLWTDWALHVVETQPPVIPESSYSFSLWEGLARTLSHLGSGAAVEPISCHVTSSRSQGMPGWRGNGEPGERGGQVGGCSGPSAESSDLRTLCGMN